MSYQDPLDVNLVWCDDQNCQNGAFEVASWGVASSAPAEGRSTLSCSTAMPKDRSVRLSRFPQLLGALLVLAVMAAACGGDDDAAVDPDPSPGGEATALPEATAQPIPEPTATVSPEPAATAEPTATVEPPPEPLPVDYRLVRCADPACSRLSSADLDVRLPPLPPGSFSVRPDGRPLVVANTEIHPVDPPPGIDFAETVIYSCDDPACSALTKSVIAEGATSVLGEGMLHVSAALLPDGSLTIGSYTGPEGLCLFDEALAEAEGAIEWTCADPQANDVGELALTICSDPDRCTETARTVTVDTEGVAGLWLKVRVDPSTGLPMILYTRMASEVPSDSPTFVDTVALLEVRVARCVDPRCDDLTVTTLTQPVEAVSLGGAAPVTLPDGTPVFVFASEGRPRGSTNESLFTCADASCAEVVETPWPANIGGLAVSGDGLPIVADFVWDLNFTVRLTFCGNRFCTEGNRTVELNEVRAGILDIRHIVLLPGGGPAVFYRAGSDEVFNPTWVTVCADAECTESTTALLDDMLGADAPSSPDLPVLFATFFDASGAETHG